MITVYYAGSGEEHELSIEGHAEYAAHGQDIVCAGVSALAQALIGWLEDNGQYVSEMVGPVIQQGRLWVSCKGNKKVTIAFQVALMGMKQIAEAYPRHMELRYNPDPTGDTRK